MNLSPTSLAAWTQCERLYEALYIYRQKFVGVRLPSMRSTWVHKGVSEILAGGFPRVVAHTTARGFERDFLQNRMVDVFGEPIISHQPGSRIAVEQGALVEACILAWARMRGGALAGWRVLQTERATRLALGASRLHESVEFVIKPDWVMVNDETMTLRPFEVKLAATIDKEWIDQWAMSPQAFWYQFALERMFPGYTIDPLWIEAVEVGRAGKLRHSSPLIYGWSAQAYPPFDPDLIWYEKPPRKALLFRAWSEADCKVPDPLGKHIEQMPERILEKRFIQVEGKAPSMERADIDQMFADVVKIADQIEARRREKMFFRWTGLMAGNCASGFGRCPFYRRCFKVNGWQDWYVTREEALAPE